MPQFQFRPDQPPLGALLTEVHDGELQLPDFQRSWVWDDERIRDLLASVSQGWPIGAILLLECGGNVRFKARAVEGVTAPRARERRLILDGQQRLTALYLALRSAAPVRTVDSKGNAVERVYFFDIQKCLDDDTDRFDAIIALPATKQTRSEFNRKLDLDLSSPEEEYRNKCIPVSVAFDGQSTRTWRRAFQEFYNHERSMSEIWDRFEQQVIESLQNYRLPSIELSKETSREAVCMVFERVNTGGKPLDVFELVTASFAADEMDLREDWNDRTSRLADCAVLKHLSGTDFLQAVTLAATYKESLSINSARKYVGCKKGDILNLALEDYRLLATSIELGFRLAAKLLDDECIFDAELLPYPTQLIPMAAIAALIGERFLDEPTRSRVLQWYWCGVFGELYSGSVESRFARDIVEVVAWLKDGPEPSTIQECNFSPTRLLSLQTRQAAAYKGIMAQLLQMGARDFFQGHEIERSNYLDEQVEIRLIFSADWCAKNDKVKDSKQKHRCNSILNKTLLAARTHKRLGGVSPKTYLERIEHGGIAREQLDEILATHVLEPTAMRENDFEAFLRERARALLDCIERSTRKSVNGRNSAETKKIFGGVLTARARSERGDSVRRLFETYEIIEELPSGGMSKGYKVRSKEGGIYFLKEVPISGIPADALRRELDVYAKLERASAVNVLRVHTFERSDDCLALVTEFADGGTLTDYVKEHAPVASPEVKNILMHIIAGLRELHSLEIVHRDLKADNVLCAAGRWKLSDFGISKNLARAVTQGRTFQGHGTPGFAPPEQLDGAAAHSSADVYSFGKLIAFLLTAQTDVDQMVLPSWGRLARRCTERNAEQRPSLDDVETELAEIAV